MQDGGSADDRPSADPAGFASPNHRTAGGLVDFGRAIGGFVGFDPT